VFQLYCANNNDSAWQFYDGTNVIAAGGYQMPSNTTGTAAMPVSASGIWLPGTTSSSTIKIQLASPSGNTATIKDQSGSGVVIDWTITQIAN
jgi:hypothetical protein